MVDVGGDHQPAARDLAADQLRSEALALGDALHLFGDDAALGVVHLGHAGAAGAGLGVVAGDGGGDGRGDHGSSRAIRGLDDAGEEGLDGIATIPFPTPA